MQFFLKHIIRLQWETILWRSKTKKHYCRTLTGKFHCIFLCMYISHTLNYNIYIRCIFIQHRLNIFVYWIDYFCCA